MLQLPNGCTCSEPSVYPSNWNKSGASIKDTWYIQYYFQDPLYKEKYPRGKCCQIKAGLNKLKTLPERRAAAKTYLAELKHLLVNMGYNPIIGRNMVETELNEYEIDPDTPFIKALWRAHEKLKCGHYTKKDIEYMIPYIEKSARQVRYVDMPIGDIRRKHILITLENCAKVKDYWSPNQFNNYKALLGMLFKILKKLGAVESNYCSDIEKAVGIKKLRRTFTKEERTLVNDHLKTNHYNFWRYMQIFYHSGARSTELLKVKTEDVDLAGQRYKVTVLKKKVPTEVWKPIKNIAMPFWAELLSLAEKDDYLLAFRMRTGKKPIDAKQISKRWREYVKSKETGLGIDVDFYELKHMNTTEVVDDIFQKLIKEAEAAAACQIK